MKIFLRWLSWQKIVFLVVLGIVIFQNKISGNQYLSGWDNLHPEINFGLELSRQLSSVWQEFRGLGHLGGMGHAADLPRTLILWLFSWVVPTNFLRWGWHISMLVLGPIGIWYMGRKLWKWSESSCFAAAMFYLLNMATVQYFYTPYEAFSTFYGFLPWLIASFVMFLENGKKKDGVRLLLVSLLATAAFYVQTLFVVYALLLVVISIFYAKEWRRMTGAWLIIVATNAFWLLPVVYFVLSSAQIVGVSKINSIASPETAYMNQGMGGWTDVLRMNGFWLEYLEWRGDDWGRLMQVWQEWSNRNVVQILSLSVAGLSIVGMVVGAIKKRISWWVSAIFVLTFIMLASSNPPFGFVYTYLTDKVPFFGEMFRSMFTKWSVVMGMVIALGLGAIVEVVRARKWLATILLILIVSITGYVVWPVFGGNLIFKSMKVDHPSEYSQLYAFLDGQDLAGRVAYLPTAWAWGWQYHNWGYRGSGFLWYGIEQPILDRAFDVWSPYNEAFYNEFSTALYGGKSENVVSILKKYDVRYVLLDESVIAPGQGDEFLRIPETKEIMEQLGAKQVFNEGFLTVWDMGRRGDQFVSSPSSYTLVDGDTSKARQDIIYDETGSYVDSTDNGITYPFASLMREEVIGLEYEDKKITLSSERSPKIAQGSELRVLGWKVGDIVRIEFDNEKPMPAYIVNGIDGPKFLGKEKPEDGKNYLVARVSEGEEWSEYRESSRFKVQGESIAVEIPGEPMVYDFGEIGKEKIESCDVLKRGIASKSGNGYMADERGAACDYIEMKELDTRLSYLMRVQGENRQGRSLKFFLYNTGSKRNDVEYLLGKNTFDQSFSLLPWEWDGFYTLNIETRSFGNKAENIVAPIEVRWLPLEQIARAMIEPQSSDRSPIIAQGSERGLRILEVKKTGTWLYRVKVEGSGLLKLSQGYDEGWIAPPVSHVKVDGWANGWVIENSGEVTILYWPQLLQYLGFFALIITVWVSTKPKK